MYLSSTLSVLVKIREALLDYQFGDNEQFNAWVYARISLAIRECGKKCT